MSKHFGWTEEYVKWKLSWDNLTLYISSIPDPNPEPPKEKLQVMDANDVF